MIKAIRKGFNLPIEDGVILSSTATEKLDEVIIKVVNVSRLDLSPLDVVTLKGLYDTDRRFLIDTFSEETIDFENEKYNYQINLISETILLQRIVCPNLTIKQPLKNRQKTIKKKLQEYYEVYIQPQYPQLILSDELLELTANTKAPEIMFNKPTMYEVFQYLLSIFNKLPIIINNKISYISMDEKGKAIDKTKLHFDNYTQSVKDYANRLEVNVSNAISNDNNFSTIDGMTVRTDNVALITDTNMKIILDKPIYDLSEGEVFVYFGIKNLGNQEYKTMKVSLNDNIVEKNVYETLLTGATSLDKDTTYRIMNLYYTMGKNTIEGLDYEEGFIIKKPAILRIIESKIPSGWELSFSNTRLRENIAFSVKYKTSDNFRYIVEKEKEHNATLIDNQTEEQLQTDLFGHVEENKLNRLGNRSKIITATYFNSNEVPQLLDYIDDYILGERELVYYNDFIQFKGYLFKDYIIKDIYYGLSSKKRFTVFSNEYMKRNDIINYDVRFTFANPEYVANSDQLRIARYILQPLTEVSGYHTTNPFNEMAKYCAIRIEKEDGNLLYLNNDYILKNNSIYTCGSSNVITFEFNDNISAGEKISDNYYTTDGSTQLVQTQKMVKYVDDVGEFKKIKLRYFTSHSWGLFDETADAEQFRNSIRTANNLPLITEGDLLLQIGANNLFETDLTLYKDNAEQTAITTIFNYQSTEDVVLGSKFANYTGFGLNRNYLGNENVYIYLSKERYVKGDKYCKGERNTNPNIKISQYTLEAFDANGTLFNSITLLGDTGIANAWALGNEKGELIFAVNKPVEYSPNVLWKAVYLNVERKKY